MALAVVGCSKGGKDEGTALVTGKVTYNGQSVDGATVTFVSDAGGAPGGGRTLPDGTFTLRVKPGTYAAVVTKTDIPVNTQAESMEEAAARADKPPEQPKELIPAKYRDAAASPLKFEVKASGENKFELTLTN
jgi:hypothetical protein